MLMLCLSWGFNQVAVKLVLPDIPPFLQAFVRSCGARVVLLVIARDADPVSGAAGAVADGLSGRRGGGVDIFDMFFNG